MTQVNDAAYQPKWTNRRRLVFSWIGFTAASLSASWSGWWVIPEGVQLSLLWLNGLLMTWYLVGPAAEGISQILTWKR